MKEQGDCFVPRNDVGKYSLNPRLHGFTTIAIYLFKIGIHLNSNELSK